MVSMTESMLRKIVNAERKQGTILFQRDVVKLGIRYTR